MVRDEYASWIPEAHMLLNHKDRNIITQFLWQIKTWCYHSWKLRYVTDDSAAEQRAVKLAFPGLVIGEMEGSHFLCHTHHE